jgi:hypothetical protein
MAHEIAKAVLEQATTAHQRVKAVRVAFRLGMPLHEIEEYLDWLDVVRQQQKAHQHRSSEGGNQERQS